jgi:hypothetical protein
MLSKHASSASEVDILEEFKSKLSKLKTDEVNDENKIKDDFWIEFEDFIDQCDPQNEISKKVISKWEVPIVWGWWSWLHEGIPIPHGYSDKHDGMIQGPSNPSGRHVYKGRPKRVRWRLHPVMDGDKVRFYTATAPICEVDAVSGVPAIPEGLKIWDISKRVLNPSLKVDQWQRGLDTSRIVSIRAFVDNPRNSFSNAAMVFAPDHPSVDWELDSEGIPLALLVDFQFLKEDKVKKAPYLTDNTPSRDLRPLRIIDGQHRVRGGMRSERGSTLEIPIVLFPPDLKNRGAAKYFAEVNTLAEPLNILHELFMRHKFALGSTKPAKTFAKYDYTKKTHRDRANRLAYEAAAYLNLNMNPENESSDSETGEFGALFNLIKMLIENTTESNYVISAEMWIKFAYQWFMPNGPYPPSEERDKKDNYFQEIANYFDAFMSVCNGKEWSENDTDDRWMTWEWLQAKDTNSRRPYIQYNTTVRALLVNYSNIVKIIRDGGYKNTIISRKRFVKTLGVWGNIDWLDPRIKDTYVKSGEYHWQSLARWLRDATGRGEVDAHPISDVMSTETSSVRGKGILSPVSEGEVSFVDDRYKWPHPSEPVRLVANRPINARRGCRVHLMDYNLKQINQKADLKVEHTAKPDDVMIEVEHWDGIEDYDELTLRCTWGNSVDKNVSSTITLEKP